jgi:hypothetical protein
MRGKLFLAYLSLTLFAQHQHTSRKGFLVHVQSTAAAVNYLQIGSFAAERRTLREN